MPNIRIKMMCKCTLILVICVSFCAHLASANPTILFTSTQIDFDTWQYVYEIENTSTAPIEAFYILYDETLYTNLAIETEPPLSDEWDEIILNPTVSVPYYDYDVLALAGGIAPDETVGGFTVSFDWLGDGLPASQPFYVYDPTTWQNLEEGATIPAVIIPAPTAAMLALTGLGVLGLRRRK